MYLLNGKNLNCKPPNKRPVPRVESLFVLHMGGQGYRWMCCCRRQVVSDPVRPQRWQPTRLPRPWDSPGKNTGVGCHFLLQCMKVKNEAAQSYSTLSHPMDYSPPGSSVHGIFQARVLEWGAIAFSKVDVRKWQRGMPAPSH